MHDALFRDQTKIDQASQLEHATNLNLDLTLFASCLKDASTAERVRRDLDSARAMRITSTPTFLIGLRQPDAVSSLSGPYRVPSRLMTSPTPLMRHLQTSIEPIHLEGS
jgi:predicted DsbA family dithiol-disulfide isomerase